MHFTETCDPDLPHLITCVQTTDASATDMQQTQEVHEVLARRDLLPQTHVVDAGYVDAGVCIGCKGRISTVIPICSSASIRKPVESVLVDPCVHAPRLLTIRSQEEFLQLQRTRKLQETEQFQATYAMRSGIEGTHSEAGAIAGVTPISLSWLGEDGFATPSHCCCNQSSSYG